jgi:tetratricopeptide (TPR) repeat protein
MAARMTTSNADGRALTLAMVAAFGRADKAEAARLARQLIALSPLDPNANQILGIVLLEAGDAAGAKAHLLRADAAAPNQSQIVNSLAVAMRRLGETEPARARFRRAGELGLIDGWRNLGALEESERRFDASIAAYERALALAKDDAASHAAMAQAYERRHELARAKDHALRALKGDPHNDIARLALAHVLMRERDFASAEQAALPVTTAGLPSRTNRAMAWGVVGEARDRMGDAKGAFAAFTAANQILLQDNASLLTATHLLYHPEGVRRMTALALSADFGRWPPLAPQTTPAPAFLVGFPRSGTTLLDQILTSHSGIVCIEEREHLANALAAVLGDPRKLEAFEALGDDEIALARHEYWRQVEAEAGDLAGKLVIDKLPLNIVVLPLIKRVFPDAKIILALRDPRDVILSCYQQRFGMNAAMAQFLQLDTAATYYDLIMNLLETCRARLALTLHQVRYEDVVGDLEAAARALTSFLGLEFEPAMLSFRETALKRDIGTPSARQVIEPLYARSIGRWRRYADELAPALPVLAPWVERYGYGG